MPVFKPLYHQSFGKLQRVLFFSWTADSFCALHCQCLADPTWLHFRFSYAAAHTWQRNSVYTCDRTLICATSPLNTSSSWFMPPSNCCTVVIELHNTAPQLHSSSLGAKINHREVRTTMTALEVKHTPLCSGDRTSTDGTTCGSYPVTSHWIHWLQGQLLTMLLHTDSLSDHQVFKAIRTSHSSVQSHTVHEFRLSKALPMSQGVLLSRSRGTK